MPKPIPSDDFRALRHVFTDDEISMYYCGEEWPPINRVEPIVWAEITLCPDDVSYRTGDRHGPLLKELVGLISMWCDITPEKCPLFDALVDAIEEFKATAFNCLHGYYRPAIGCLRLALEYTAIGAYLKLCAREEEVTAWREGTSKASETGFGFACDKLRSRPRAKGLDSYLRVQHGDDLLSQQYNQPNEPEFKPGGWARRLHAELCHYSHAQLPYGPTTLTLVDGPMYTYQSLELAAGLLLETSAIGCLLVQIASPGMHLPEGALHSPSMQSRTWQQLAFAASAYLTEHDPG